MCIIQSQNEITLLNYHELAPSAQEQAWKNFNAEQLWEAADIDGHEITDDVPQDIFTRYFADTYWYFSDGSIFEKQ